jgi:poly(3-hydroxybutyrate) depolymerase
MQCVACNRRPGGRSDTVMAAMRRLSLLVLAALAGLPGPVARPAAQAAARSDAEERSMSHGGRTRSYLVHDFARGRPAPVVIVLHGGGGNAANALKMTGFNRIAAREGAMAVYPNGTASRERGVLLTWNAGHCCAAAMQNRVDDVGFIGALIDALVAEGRADASRIYVTGMSNGGMMAHRLGRELSSKIAAIAPVVGAVFGDEPAPRAPTPALIVVGATDPWCRRPAARCSCAACSAIALPPIATWRPPSPRPPTGSRTTAAASPRERRPPP